MKDKDTNVNIAKIRAKSNKNLIYVWVPVNDEQSIKKLNDARETLNQYYTNYSVENNWTEAEDPKNTEEYNQLLQSINEYGGFYFAEAELGYDKEGKLCNIARGMKNSSVEELTGGEYYRGEQIKTYEKAKEIARYIDNDENSSVVSHLTYGAEWDTVMLWVMKTNKAPSVVLSEDVDAGFNDIVRHVIQSSIYMPGHKYVTDVPVNNVNLATEKIQRINGIYGLAGNLCDLTQEGIVENEIEYRILRGGSFATQANITPLAARQKVESIEGKDIGFRNCLYIKPMKQYEEQQDEGENSLNLDELKADVIKQIGNYVPFGGWDYVTYWEEYMNFTIKSNAIENIKNATSIDEINKIKQECEDEIEKYVGEKQLEGKKDDTIKQIGDYEPSYGWVYVERWEEYVNFDIKDPAIEEIRNATSIDEINKIKQECEDAIEKYVGEQIEKAKEEEN